MKTSFRTEVKQEEGMNATGLPVPASAVATLGTGKRPKVVVHLNGYSYRSTVAAYGDVFMLPLAAEHRKAAGVKAGDTVDVTLELDVAPRTVEVPPDLATALAAKEGARTAFDAWSFTNRKEAVRQVETAKAEDTRARRIAAIVAKLP